MSDQFEENATKERKPRTLLVDREIIHQIGDQIESLRETAGSFQNINVESISLNEIKQNASTLVERYLELWQGIQHMLISEINTNALGLLKNTISIEFLKQYGLSLMKKNVINRPLGEIQFTRSLEENDWKEIRSVAFTSENIKLVLQKISLHYRAHLDKQIDLELQKVGIPIEDAVKAEYRKSYYRSPISFDSFLESNAPKKAITSNQPANVNAREIREKYERAIEKKKLDTMKQSQEQSFDNYKIFFQMDDRELARAKRQGDMQKRVYSKKSRREKFTK